VSNRRGLVIQTPGSGDAQHSLDWGDVSLHASSVACEVPSIAVPVNCTFQPNLPCLLPNLTNMHCCYLFACCLFACCHLPTQAAAGGPCKHHSQARLLWRRRCHPRSHRHLLYTSSTEVQQHQRSRWCLQHAGCRCSRCPDAVSEPVPKCLPCRASSMLQAVSCEVAVEAANSFACAWQ
jgi:hypothetical protein